MSHRRDPRRFRENKPAHCDFRDNRSRQREDVGARGDLIMGRNCIEEVIKRAPKRLIEVFLLEGRDDATVSFGKRRVEIEQLLQEQRVPIRYLPRRELDLLVSSDSHQGVIARVTPRRLLDLEALIGMVQSEQAITILALDGVTDPQNFGAILRAAECLSVDAVIWSKNRGAPIGPVVSKVSVGASELVSLCPVANLHQALERLKGAGAWISGTLISDQAKPLDSFEFPEKSVVVIGAEGEGIHQLIRRELDFSIYITMNGAIDSLNVSQATAVVLHEIAKQRRQKGSLKVT